jgi:hypothetical protein
VAEEFVQWLDVPTGRRWLDVGCGIGAARRGDVRLDDHEIRPVLVRP